MTWEDWLQQTGAYQYSDGGEGAGTGGLFHESLRNGDGGIKAGLFSGDDTPEQKLRSFYDQQFTPGADGKLPWGTEGLNFDSSGNAGSFFNQPGVTLGGQNFARVSEDPNTWRGMELGSQVKNWLTQNPGSQAQYNDQYGWLMPQDRYQQLSKASEIDGQMDSSFTNWAPYVNMAMMGGAAAAGASAMGAAGGAGATAGAEAASPFWGDLYSTYGAAEGAAAGSSLPSNYWSMLADAGGVTSDAGAVGAGSMDASSFWGDLYSQYGNVSDLTSFNDYLSPYLAPGQSEYLQSIAPNYIGAQSGMQTGIGGVSGLDALMQGFTTPATLPTGGGAFDWQDIAKRFLSGANGNGSGTLDQLLNGNYAGALGSGLNQGASLAARLGPGMLALQYANNQTGGDTSKLDSVYGKLEGMGGVNPYSNDILNAYDQRTGQARGDLMSGLERRGVMGSSFGNMDLSNFDTSSQAQRGTLASGLYNADRNFGLQATNSQGAVANQLLNAQMQQKAIQSALFGRAFDIFGKAVSPSPSLFGSR